MILFDLENDSIALHTEHDFQGMDFVWYEEPVPHFDLRTIYSRISSFDQLKYYAEVLLYLNPDLDYSTFQGIFYHIGNRESGKTIRSYSKPRISDMISDVYNHPGEPYCRRLRRIIFNPEVIMSSEEKMEVAAQILKRGMVYTKEDVLQAIDSIFRKRFKITQESLSKELYCSTKTVQRIVNQELKKIIKEKNMIVQRENKIDEVIGWIDSLSDTGDKIKIRDLKSLTSVRDYTIIKEAMSRYENEF